MRIQMRVGIVAGLLLLAAGGLGFCGLDVTLFVWLRRCGLSLDSGVWSSLTIVGDALVAPLLLVPFLQKRPQLLLAGFLAALVATLETHGIKPILDVPRPPAVLDLAVIGPVWKSGSFPSGHTVTAFTVLGLLVIHEALVTRWQVLLGGALALMIGISRIMVGVHWPTDVLGGAGLGLVAALVGSSWAFGIQNYAIVERAKPLLTVVVVTIALADLIGNHTGYIEGLWLQRLIAAVALALLFVKRAR